MTTCLWHCIAVHRGGQPDRSTQAVRELAEIKLILWSKLAQKCFDLVKSSKLYAPSKPSFKWFATAHGESGERSSCDVKSRTNASSVLVRSSILHGCRSNFTTQVFCWDPTVDRFLFLVTMSSTLSHSKMAFDSEESEIYYIAEDMR